MKVPEDLLSHHYCQLRTKPFYPELVQYMTSGPVVVMVSAPFFLFSYKRLAPLAYSEKCLNPKFSVLFIYILYIYIYVLSKKITFMYRYFLRSLNYSLFYFKELHLDQKLCHTNICFVQGCGTMTWKGEKRKMRVTFREKITDLLICVRLLLVLEPAGSAPCWWLPKSFPHFPTLNCSLEKIIHVWVHWSSVFSVPVGVGGAPSDPVIA